MITTPTFDDIQNLYGIAPILTKKANELRDQARGYRFEAGEAGGLGLFPESVKLLNRRADGLMIEADEIDRAVQTIYVLLMEI